MRLSRLAPVLAAAAAFLGAACDTRAATQKGIEALWEAGPRPDSLPVMKNADLPVRYPSALYAQKVQGNVTLRIYIDSTGRVHADSTAVVEASGYAAFDSAAITGVRALSFRPAIKDGAPMAVSILFPVFFRHPEGKPLPGDTVLKK